MLKAGVVLVEIFFLVSAILVVSNSCLSRVLVSGMASNSFLDYSPQVRQSNYMVETRTITPYPQINMSDQRISPSNASLLEQTLNLDLSTPTTEVNFTLASYEAFLAIDGASQSSTLRVNYTIYYPNGTQATNSPITTSVTSPMHLYILNPPEGTWRVVATRIVPGETTAWIQAISYNNGTKWVSEKEKLQIHLVSGQNLYFKIPLLSTDWFYLYVNKFARADILIDLRKQGAYQTPYKYYNNLASDFFPSKSHTPGVYLLKIINKGTTYGDTDIFLEIIKPLGIDFALNLDVGNTIQSSRQVDLEFFNLTVNQSCDWIAFDGAVISGGMSASYLIINPNLDVIFTGTSSDPSSFQTKLIPNPLTGTYVVAVFGSQYATATIKITSAVNVESIALYTKLDQNWTFTQSGQTFYLKIAESSWTYFLFAGTTFSSSKVMYKILDPNLNSIWTWGPSTGFALYPPTKPSVSFYILSITGQTNSASLVHVRFQGLEDYQLMPPDCSDYRSRFKGDIVISAIYVWDSASYILQHIGAFCSPSSNVYIALFDSSCNPKWSKTFTNNFETSFQRWRKGYENPTSGGWIQVFVGLGDYGSAQISTLQSGDESKYVVTPFQCNETVDWQDFWQVHIHKVNVNPTNWFGIVSQLLSVNMSYTIHPTASMWVYDSNLKELLAGQIVDINNRFRSNFWPNPTSGFWIVVIVGFQNSQKYDPLNLSVTYVGAGDFQRPLRVHNVNTGLNYTEIQEAIDAPETLDGHTLMIEPGTYYEHIVVDKAVSLIGEGADRTVIDGFSTRFAVVQVKSDNATLDGFSVRNGYFGVLLSSIRYCNVLRNALMNNGVGIAIVQSSSSNNISDNVVTSNSWGVALGEAEANIVEANNVTGSSFGILLFNSPRNVLRNNTLSGNRYNFGVQGSNVSDYINDVEPSNTIDGKPILYLVNASNLDFELDPSSIGYLGIVNSTNIIVRGPHISGNREGALLAYTSNSLIENCSFTNNAYGIFMDMCINSSVSQTRMERNSIGAWLESSNYTTFRKNRITLNDYGVYSLYSNGIDIALNTISNSSYGIWVGYSSQGVGIVGNAISNCSVGILIADCPQSINISGNAISNSMYEGIYLFGCSHGIISGNKISQSQYYGFFVYNCSELSIYHNNFINNTWSAISYYSTNIWDNGYPSGGNYWSDYTGVDANHDGIGDTPYIIDQNNTDKYPLMYAWPDTDPPSTNNDYDGLWHTSDFTITLIAADNGSGVAKTYYRINEGPTKSIDVDGQPLITIEGFNNTLEFWSRDNADIEELPHNLLTGIKLDKTPPTGSIEINNGSAYTTLRSVTLTINAIDAMSGVYRVRYSNDGVWDTEPWEIPLPNKAWTLTAGDGTKTVYYQIRDSAGLISETYSDTITLDTTAPVMQIPTREPAGYIQPDQPVEVSVNITDIISQVKNVTLFYTIDNGTTWEEPIPMNFNASTGLYEATIPGQPAGIWVRFKIVAYDNAGNQAVNDNQGNYYAYQVIPEFPSTIILPVFMLTTLVATTLLKKKRKTKPQLP